MATVEGSFNPNAAISGTASINLSRGWIRIYNESNVGVLLTMANGDTYFLPAFTRKTILLDQPSPTVQWKQYASYAFGAGQVISAVIFESLFSSEVRVEDDLVGLGPREINVGVGQDINTIFGTTSLNGVLDGSFNSTSLLIDLAPPISMVSAQEPAFLTLLALDLAPVVVLNRAGTAHKRSVWASTTFTVPGSISGNLQVMTVSTMDFLKSVVFGAGGIPSGVTLTKLEISFDNGATYFDLGIPSATTGPLVIDIGSRFDAADGASVVTPGTNHSNAFKLRFTFNNSNVGSSSVPVQVAGSVLFFDEATWQITYVDWTSTQYALGNIRLSSGPLHIPLNLTVPLAITNPAQTNFGSIALAANLPAESDYQGPSGGYNFNVVLLANVGG